MDTPPGIIALCRKKENNQIIGDKILYLDDIQDPGNLGTIIRSSLAFNVSTIVLSPNSVDLYNPKVLRATQGMYNHINIVVCDINDVFNYVQSNNIPLYGTSVVIVRGYIGYGIPTSWNKTTFQTFMLFSIMGIGKCLGGIVADMIGVKKTALLSTILAIPFLLCGNNYMLVSLIGVMFFSMTMSITLAILVSVLKKTPGLAFGLTTIGLFLGTLPIFFFRFETALSNGIIVCILSLVCFTIFNFIIRSDKDV